MRKLQKASICTVALSILFVFGCVKTASSQSVANMSASVGVNAVFGITVSPLSLDFPSADPGTTTGVRELTAWCSSNNNQAWSVQLSNVAELTSGSYTIPNANFHWWGWSTGNGTWNAGTAAMSTTPFTFYECSVDEYITTSPIELHLSFNVDVPAGQVAGTYASTLTLTMTE